jgi:hypothetical protein
MKLKSGQLKPQTAPYRDLKIIDKFVKKNITMSE